MKDFPADEVSVDYLGEPRDGHAVLLEQAEAEMRKLN
jgi:hypothetical protein